MIINNEDIGTPIVKAFNIVRKNSFDKYIEISKDDKRIAFYFKDKDFDHQSLEKNIKTKLNDLVYWDVTLKTKDTYYLFDLTKEKVFITRLDDNLYNLEVDIKNPDMIYCPLGEKETFNNLYLNINFSFVFDDNSK